MKTDNELIAEFVPEFMEDQNWHKLHWKDAPFDKSWDWLMPVVEKIESIEIHPHGHFGVHIHSNGCDIQGTNLWMALEGRIGYENVYMSDPNAILKTKIESTYYNVVQFIKWYNSVISPTGK